MAEAQVTESHFFEHIKRLGKIFSFADLREKLDRFGHGQFQYVVDRFAMHPHFQHVRLKAAAFAFGAAHIEVAQKLHLDFFKTGAATTFATSAAGIKRERARGQALQHRFGLRGKKFADAIVKTEIKDRG